jgi:hypothetical protein
MKEVKKLVIPLVGMFLKYKLDHMKEVILLVIPLVGMFLKKN